MNYRNGAIIGSGAAVPKRKVPNSFFNEVLGEDVDTWLQTNVQIYNRHWLSEDESVADLVTTAGQKAIDQAGIHPSMIDLCIVATDTPEFISPSTAVIVQNRLGLTNAGTFDLNSACAGFVTALDTGSKFIQADVQYNHVLIIGAYGMSRYLNLKDKKTVTLFADGAAGVVLKATEDGRGLLQSKLASMGEYNEWMGIYAGGSAHPITHKVLDQKGEKLQFVKKIPTEINPTKWPEMIVSLCEREGLIPNEIKGFFFTQININTIWQTMDTLGVNRDKAATIMQENGYTGSAAIPMAFDDWYQKGKVQKDDLVIFMGSGGGLSFASALFKI